MAKRSKGDSSCDTLQSYGPSGSASGTSRGSRSSKSRRSSDGDSCGIKSDRSICTDESIDSKKSKKKSSGISSCLKRDGNLKVEYEALQAALFKLTSQFAKVQFRLRQIMLADPIERDRLLGELATVACCENEEFEYYNLPKSTQELICLGNVRQKPLQLIKQLRRQMTHLCEHTVARVELETDETKKVTVDDDKKGKKDKDKKDKDKKDMETTDEESASKCDVGKFERKPLLPPFGEESSEGEETDMSTTSKTSVSSKSSKVSKSSKSSKSDVSEKKSKEKSPKKTDSDKGKSSKKPDSKKEKSSTKSDSDKKKSSKKPDSKK